MCVRAYLRYRVRRAVGDVVQVVLVVGSVVVDDLPLVLLDIVDAHVVLLVRDAVNASEYDDLPLVLEYRVAVS